MSDVSLDLLARELGRLSAAIAAEEAALAAGSAAEKTQAAGDLAALKQQSHSIRERLEQLRERGSDSANDVMTGIDLELRDLGDAFERWLDR
jgi:uncharacterized protein involved in exopolysaccharide biosynthesis